MEEPLKSYLTLDDVDVANKRVIVRADLNVPMKDGVITDDTRLERILPTLKELLEKGAAVVLMSHFGRPKGQADPQYSLKPIFESLTTMLPETHLQFSDDFENIPALKPGELLLLENLRFHSGEESNDPAFAKTLSTFGDIYVNDAFSASHRAHASIEGITHYLPAYAGRLMQEELGALEKTLGSPQRPLMAIVGGAKVSTKLALLMNLVEKVDVIAIGGAMANTFLKAQGHPVGASLVEDDLRETAKDILKNATEKGCTILLPSDVVVAEKIEPNAASRVIPCDEIRPSEMILDVGPMSQERIKNHLKDAKTLLWNGPLGVFEAPPFDQGTNAVAQLAAQLTQDGKLISVGGGGDTIAALSHAGAIDDFFYVSTAGGAFLEWLEGRELPGVESLKRSLGSNTNTVVPSSSAL